MLRTALTTACLVALVGWLGVSLLAQEEPRSLSPHGDLAVDCQQCHTPEGWTPLARPLPFDHDEVTGFPLRAAHAQVDCLSCHGDLRFQRVASACADCHQDPHQRTLGLDCESCHAPSAWDDRGRLRDLHFRTLFPLTGAHANADCAACHRGAAPHQFSAAPTDCFSCHRQDYLQTTEPNHQQVGFPTDCSICHDTRSFEGGDFRAHDSQFFPIFSGTHRGVWANCSECHGAAGGFATFSCVSCHEHRRSEMDDEHDDVRGYVYDSVSCLGCHPTGRE